MTPAQMTKLMTWVDAKITLALDKGGAEERGEMQAREEMFAWFGLIEDQSGKIIEAESE